MICKNAKSFFGIVKLLSKKIQAFGAFLILFSFFSMSAPPETFQTKCEIDQHLRILLCCQKRTKKSQEKSTPGFFVAHCYCYGCTYTYIVVSVGLWSFKWVSVIQSDFQKKHNLKEIKEGLVFCIDNACL
jgi:hypothetical protein